ncbi:unnamed protein product [Mycena citricolor]|uniref:Uncharacterized protein n=1 Tax=Mycena citricolor TaxID=2018698 RepID=A0AAD2HFE9_9AGAR|nr:unnamed protein product [Mycena citricolor]
MAGFLRKKKVDPGPPPADNPPPPPLLNAAPPPLFARFASSLQAQDAAPKTTGPRVSGPMSLASASQRHNNHTGSSSKAATGQQRDEMRQSRRPGETVYTQPQIHYSQTSASNGGVPPHSRHSPPPRSQTLPQPPSASPAPVDLPNRRLSHVADKPLPALQSRSPDPLAAPPPSSALPPNRRISARGYPQPGSAPQRFTTTNGRVQPEFSSQGPMGRYPNETGAPDFRNAHKLPDAGGSGSGAPVEIVPASEARTAPGLGASEPRLGSFAASGTLRTAPYEEYDPSLSSATQPTNPGYASPSPAAAAPDTPIKNNMGVTLSSIDVQTYHAHGSARNKRVSAPPVRGKPLIFAAMEPATEKPQLTHDPRMAYPSPPSEAAIHRIPPLKPEDNNANLGFDFDLDYNFSRALDDWGDARQQVHAPPPLRIPNGFPANGPPPVSQTKSGDKLSSPVNGFSSPISAPPPLSVPVSFIPTPAPPSPSPSPPRRVSVARSPMRVGPPQMPNGFGSPRSPPQQNLPARSPSPPPRAVDVRPLDVRPIEVKPIDVKPPTAHRTLVKPRSTTPQRKPSIPQIVPEVNRQSMLLLDEDPFAKIEGVRVMAPSVSSPVSSSAEESLDAEVSEKASVSEKAADLSERATVVSENATAPSTPERTVASLPSAPSSPEDYRAARSQRRGNVLDKAPPPSVLGVEVRETRIPGPFPLALFVADPQLLTALLPYLSFYEWCILSAVSKEIRITFVGTKDLREAALERYLRTVGYARWTWADPDPLELTLLDLHDYMRGVSLPSHEYSRVADAYVQSFNLPPDVRDPVHLTMARSLTSSTRAYTRVVLRLRAQAEREASDAAALKYSMPPPRRIVSNGYSSSRSSPSRTSSRAPSPTPFGGSHHSHPGHAAPFRSPLFKLRRAPLLRVFVPSPDGDWLSDKSVLECEAELKRAGVLNLLRVGDVVWDIAVGDEGNVGRLIWDGSYLIDLDYKYSAVGDLPQYLPTLAFPPSYFHRVIRTGPTSTNPVAHMDISPWGHEIAANLQLLQDRIRTETPQGNVHNVVRWVHRSSFVIRPPARNRASMSPSRGSRPESPRIPIPESAGLFVDPGWYGTIVVETEGTNEALADLQDRCPGAFPPRAGGQPTVVLKEAKDARKVWKILREKSRPAEIWIRAVGPKERLF